MQVLFTIIVIGVAAAWLVAVQQRLERLRSEVRAAWKILEANQGNDAAKTVYNNHVASYNHALETFPANLVGPLAGFKPARTF